MIWKTHAAAVVAKSFSKKELLAICGLFLASVLFYIPTLRYSFVWDDTIVLSSQIHGMKGYHLFLGGGDYYRPFLALAEGLDYAIWGPNPLGFHLTNILLNAVCAPLVFISALYLLGHEQFYYALAVSLLFALSPIHADSAAWISGRTDIIAALFFFAAFLSYVAYRKYNDPKGLALSALFFLFSLFGKENGILLPVVLVSYDILIGRRRLRETLAPSAVNLSVICFYLFLRNPPHLQLQNVSADLGPGVASARIHGIGTAALDAIYSLGFYFKKLILPMRLTIFPDIYSYTNLAAFAFFSALGGFLTYKYLEGHKKAQQCPSFPQFLGGNPGRQKMLPGIRLSDKEADYHDFSLPLFGLIFVLATILPSLPVLFIKVPTPVAVRYLYLPVFGSSLLIVWIIGLIRPRVLQIVLFAGLIALCTVGLHSRNADWKDNLSLWEHDVSVNPDSAMARSQLAAAIYSDKDYLRAEKEINYILFNMDKLRANESLKDDLYSNLYNTLGLICFERKDLKDAEKNFVTALKWDDKNRSTFHNLGSVYLTQYLGLESKDHQLLERANIMYGRASKLDNLYPNSKYGLAYTSQLLGRKAEAAKYYNEVMALDPGSPIARMAWKSLTAMGTP